MLCLFQSTERPTATANPFLQPQGHTSSSGGPSTMSNKGDFTSPDPPAEDSSGGTDVAMIAGIAVAVVVLVLVVLIIVVLRYKYRHKGTYFTNEAKGTEFAESADAALKNDPSLQESIDESKKEYFI
ncbi:glycophorin-C-like [Rana temporaria]|uniref:glycophorin-C-like n=1 Tax=Rana temporaria TaxID=8407 RepID=UPI001AACBFE8|nr:glycophorin-C-like [Rana temporaria]